MKKIMMLALALTVTTIAFTQKPKHRPNPELRKDMHSYIDKNVVPVLQKAQNKFDAKLSPEDLKFIKTKRAELAAIHAEKKELRKAHMEKRKADRPKTEEERKARKEKFKNMTEAEKKTFREERKAKHKKMRKEMKAKHGDSKADVKAFMERNKELITATMTELKPNYETWITEQKTILEKHKPEDAPKMRKGKRDKRVGLFGLEMRGKRHHFRKGKKHGERKMDGKERRERKMKGKKGEKRKGKKIAVAFVLWDGTTPPPPIETRGNDIGNIAPNNNAKVLLGQNFPNPAKGITQIEIEIPDGVNQMTLTVTDMNGKVAQRLNLTDLSEGKEVVDIDVNSLPNGQYFYTIEYNGLQETKKMTVSH